MNKKIAAAIVASFITILIASVIGYSLPNGIVGRTKKNSTVGCSCHTMNNAITGTFSGPDTVNIGQTVVYNFTITRSGSSAKGGVNIATRLGTLAVGGGASYLRIQNGELTHQNPLTLTSGSFTGQFNYTAPASPGIDTLWLSEAVGYSNGWNWGTEKRIIVRSPVGIIPNEVAVNYQLYQNYPNPFNPSTVITFDLPKNSFISLVVYDIVGNEVEVLSSGIFSQGRHNIQWNAGNLSSGIYYYVLKSDGFSETKKMMLVK